MLGLIRKLALAGLGAGALIGTKAKKTFDELVKKGEDRRGKTKKIVEELVKKGKITQNKGKEFVQKLLKGPGVPKKGTAKDIKEVLDKLDKKVGTEIDKALKEMDIPTKEDFKILDRKLIVLTKKLEGRTAKKEE